MSNVVPLHPPQPLLAGFKLPRNFDVARQIAEFATKHSINSINAMMAG